MKPTPFVSGYVHDPPDPRDLWEDEVVAGDIIAPVRYRTNGLVFEDQGAWPFCSAMTVTKLAEHCLLQQGLEVQLSPAHLFFHGGGTRIGASFRAMFEAARTKGFVLAKDFPMPDNLYDLSTFDALRDAALKMPPDPSLRIPGYVRVEPTELDMEKAVMRYGMLAVGVTASGGYLLDGAKRPWGAEDNHMAAYVGFEPKIIWMFDSLNQGKGWTGYHTLDGTYPFTNVYAIPNVPKEAFQKAKDARMPVNAERYGKPRIYQAEVDAGYTLLRQAKRFLNEKIVNSMGPMWETYLKANVYGNWRITEPGFVPWMLKPSHILADAEHRFLTGKAKYDFSKPYAIG